jgi:hypothetical protein
MRRGYSQDIRAESITKRYQGVEWKEIQTAITQKFHVNPSIRQMQHWFEEYQGTKDDPTGAKNLAKAIEDTANLAKPLAQAQMMAAVMPLWQKLQEDPDLSVSDAGWIAFLSFFESQIGRKDFDRIVVKYRQIRNKLK